MSDRIDHRSPFDPMTEYALRNSGTPVTEDGYKHNEPKWLCCSECGASVELTEKPSAGVDEIGHGPDCDQRWSRTEWWRERVPRTE